MSDIEFYACAIITHVANLSKDLPFLPGSVINLAYSPAKMMLHIQRI
jgi:hypothetical protein